MPHPLPPPPAKLSKKLIRFGTIAHGLCGHGNRYDVCHNNVYVRACFNVQNGVKYIVQMNNTCNKWSCKLYLKGKV
jgi:hypothetical protein